MKKDIEDIDDVGMMDGQSKNSNASNPITEDLVANDLVTENAVTKNPMTELSITKNPITEPFAKLIDACR